MCQHMFMFVIFELSYPQATCRFSFRCHLQIVYEIFPEMLLCGGTSNNHPCPSGNHQTSQALFLFGSVSIQLWVHAFQFHNEVLICMWGEEAKNHQHYEYLSAVRLQWYQCHDGAVSIFICALLIPRQPWTKSNWWPPCLTPFCMENVSHCRRQPRLLTYSVLKCTA